MRVSLLILAIAFSTASFFAEARSYVPIGSTEGSAISNATQFRIVKAEDRPSLPGMRPVQLELLEDALRRKMPRTIGTSRVKAHDSIIRNSLRNPVKRSHMRGILAEALYLERNPTWGYVRSPTASQHDLYKWVDGRRAPFTAQIKTHASGNPITYAQDMKSDHRSNRFVVPDDHVSPLREYWRNEIIKNETAGQLSKAAEAKRQFARITGLGYTAKGLDNQLSRAAKYALRERQATYVSLGAALAMAVGPAISDWFHTGALNGPTAQQTTRAGAILATERATTYALGKIGTGALRGGFRGNAIPGIAVLITDTSFSIYEYGGARAFQNVGFFTHLGGGIGALALGLTTGTLVASTISPYNPMIGAATGLISTIAVGPAGYIFGQSATRKILEVTNPDFFHKAEDEAIKTAIESICERMGDISSANGGKRQAI